MLDKYCIVGLGNPGRQYKPTRHNVGFMVLDHLAEDAGISFRKKGNFAEIAETIIQSKPTVLIKPQTFMNRSGIAIAEFRRYLQYDLQNYLIVLDEVNLPLGKIRIRERGSSGGHKGLASIIEHLGTQDIARLRLGVGTESVRDDMVEFVLSKFTKGERAQLDLMITTAVEAVQSFIVDGIEITMNRFNASP